MAKIGRWLPTDSIQIVSLVSVFVIGTAVAYGYTKENDEQNFVRLAKQVCNKAHGKSLYNEQQGLFQCRGATLLDADRIVFIARYGVPAPLKYSKTWEHPTTGYMSEKDE